MLSAGLHENVDGGIGSGGDVCVCVFVREEEAGEGASVGGAIMEIEIRFTRLVCLGAGVQINYRRTFPSPRAPAAVGMYSSPTY